MPIIRQVNVIAIIIQLLLVSLLAFIFYKFDKRNYILYAILINFGLSLLLRNLIPRYHRKGVSLYKQKNFQEAIKCFEESYEYFNRYKWLDKYRFIFILNSSKISYLEMALINKAFCQSQLGKKEDAIKTYKKVLEEFPESEMAKASLKMLE